MRVHVQTVYADIPNAAKAGYNSFSKAMGAKWLTYLGKGGLAGREETKLGAFVNFCVVNFFCLLRVSFHFARRFFFCK